MVKTKTGRRIRLVLEFSKGDKNAPHVGVWDGNSPGQFFGVPEDFKEFDVFMDAARKLCKALVKAGELG